MAIFGNYEVYFRNLDGNFLTDQRESAIPSRVLRKLPSIHGLIRFLILQVVPVTCLGVGNLMTSRPSAARKCLPFSSRSWNKQSAPSLLPIPHFKRINLLFNDMNP